MRNTVIIDNKEIGVEANASTPFRYKQIFHEDIFVVLGSAKGDGSEIASITQLCYVMNMQYEKKIGKASKEDFYKWLEGFSSMAFTESAEAIFNAYLETEENQSATSKKESGQA